MQERFHYHSLEEVAGKARELGVRLPLSERLEVLRRPLTVGGRRLENRLAVQPMEGCDGEADGAPGELTLRRYLRFAQGGAGLLWLEAVAVEPRGRGNPRQLWLHEGNLDDFKRLVERVKEAGLRANGFAPLLILQATHSGRYAKPNGVPEPIIAYNNPLFEGEHPIPRERIVTDDELRALEPLYGRTARLAQEAGFDGVDVKACHRYLVSELLSAYGRKGAYGGSLENRTRLLANGVRAAQAATTGDFLVTCRLNLYDGFPYPYGFGVREDAGLEPALMEPIRVVDLLHRQLGLRMLNFTIGNPYVNPHVNRPYDAGGYEPPEHPLEGVARMFHCIGEVSQRFPELVAVSSGHSYLRQFAPQLAAGAVEQGIANVAGFGREAFAYPEFARDILAGRGLDPKRVCVCCSRCTQLMRAGAVAGCAMRDEVYREIYRREVQQR